MTTDQTIKVFPNADALAPEEETPMALAFRERTAMFTEEFPAMMKEELPSFAVPAPRMEGALKILEEAVDGFLAHYRRDIEAAALEASIQPDQPGIIAVWHGTEYTLMMDKEVPFGCLVEKRCYCGRKGSS